MRACAALVCLSELLATAPAVPVPPGALGARVANASAPRRLAEGCDLLAIEQACADPGELLEAPDVCATGCAKAIVSRHTACTQSMAAYMFLQSLSSIVGSCDPCSSSPCARGTCSTVAAELDGGRGANYLCTCADGYTGENCDEVADICASSPCQHGGTCPARRRTGRAGTWPPL